MSYDSDRADVSFALYYLSKWHKYSGPNRECSRTNPMQSTLNCKLLFSICSNLSMWLPCVQLTSLESFFFCIWNWDVISLCCRGHGTYVDGEKLIASVAGIVERVNKLICVRPFKTRYVKCVLFFINLFTEMLISNVPESHLRGQRMPSFKSSHRKWDKFSGSSLIHSHVQILPWSRTSNPGLL